ncbi:MAG: TrkH family potassium uptake protein [Saprospiraceae bacterium]
MIQFNVVGKIIGILLLIVGGLMLPGIGIAVFDGTADAVPLVWAAAITIAIGLLMQFLKPRDGTRVTKREGYLIVGLGWISMVLAGMLPYLLSSTVPTPVDAFFETMSGMTTTGASVITDIEQMPRGILFWRSMTQWIGGMGIIVLTVAIFPLLGIGGIELFVAESPGPTSDKIHPRIQETAKRLWFIYVGLTAALIILLYAFGMSGYDAINHALTTMSTGGFSTKNASIAAFDSPGIQYTIIVFMLLAGTNFTVLYFAFKARWRKVWRFDEFKMYLIVIGVLICIMMFGIRLYSDSSFEGAFREAAFQVVSIVTTTGFVSSDYTAYADWLTMAVFIMLFLGGSAGSTSGGIKLIRHLVFLKNCIREFKRILHPRAMISLKLNGQVVQPRIITHILVFLLVYLFFFVLGSVLLAALGLDFPTAIGAAATSIGNVGPGIGSVGPVDNFAFLPQSAKLILAFLMLVGRLELFTILLLFTPYFWKSN